jgi:putative SOS response-associated peptidase YedK
MMITAPNALAATVHDRMPVRPRRDQFDTWLDGSTEKNCSSRRRGTIRR